MIIVTKVCPVAQIIVLEFLTIGIHSALADKFSRNTYPARAHVGFGAWVAVIARFIIVCIDTDPSGSTVPACIIRAYIVIAAIFILVARIHAVIIAPVPLIVIAVIAFFFARVHMPVAARGENAGRKTIIRIVVIGVIAIFTWVSHTIPTRGQRAVVPAPVRINIITVIAPFARVNHPVAAVSQPAVPPACVRFAVTVQIIPVVAFLFPFDNPVAAFTRSILLNNILLSVHPILHILFTVLRVILRSFIATACLEHKNQDKNKT